jgi:hypothetical protein
MLYYHLCVLIQSHRLFTLKYIMICICQYLEWYEMTEKMFVLNKCISCSTLLYPSLGLATLQASIHLIQHGCAVS